MMSKTYIAGLCIAVVTTEAMQVAIVQIADEPEGKTDTIDSVDIVDMHTTGYFKDKNALYNSKTASEKKDDLWTIITEDDTMQTYYWKEFNELFTTGDSSLTFC